jgi:hypothetical protein
MRESLQVLNPKSAGPFSCDLKQIEPDQSRRTSSSHKVETNSGTVISTQCLNYHRQPPMT